MRWTAVAGATPLRRALPRGGPRPDRSLEVLRRRERRIGPGQPRPGLRGRPDRARPAAGPAARRGSTGSRPMSRCPANPALDLGKGDFTLAVWVHTEESLDDVLGDLVSKYDPAARRGLNWCIKSGAGMTNSQANDRNVHFGIDAGTEPVWSDRGRPGNAVYVMAMAVHDGKLFVGHLRGRPGRGGTRLPVRRRLALGRLRQPRPLQRRHLARGLRRQALRGHGPLPPGRLGLARIDEREPGRQGRPLRRRRQLGRLRPVARRGSRGRDGRSSAASSTPRRCTSRPASSATSGGDAWQRCPLARRRPPGRRPRRLQWTSLRGVVRLLLRLPVRRQGLGGLPRPGDVRPDVFVRGPRGRAVRRDLAERAGVPARSRRAVGLGRPARGGEGGHGDGRPQRQALRRDAPARGGLSPRRRHALDPDRPARPDPRRALPPGVVDGRLRRASLLRHAPLGARPRAGGRPERDLSTVRWRPAGGTSPPSARGDGSPSSSTGRASRRRLRSERPAPGPDQPDALCGSASGRTTISGAVSATSASTTGRSRPARSPP